WAWKTATSSWSRPCAGCSNAAATRPRSAERTGPARPTAPARPRPKSRPLPARPRRFPNPPPPAPPPRRNPPPRPRPPRTARSTASPPDAPLASSRAISRDDDQVAHGQYPVGRQLSAPRVLAQRGLALGLVDADGAQSPGRVADDVGSQPAHPPRHLL